MDFGALIFPTDYAIPVDRLAELLEDRGFESIWVPEHPAIPVDRRTPYPPGEPLPKEYWSALDPFVALAFAARATKRLKLGTGICLVPERDPIQLAKSVASLDLLSGGRVVFGIGGGWLGEEMELFGTAYDKRWAVTRERVLAMKRLWTEAEPEYHGRYVNFPPIKVFPKPVQKPHPPVLIGAGSRWARQRVVDWADGWMPNFITPERMARGLDDIRRRAAEKGRDMSTISATAFGSPHTADAVRGFAEAGAQRVVFSLPSESEAEILPRIDRLAKLM
ncbi:MAG: LLM class F420-dependent oxidoreductase [Dehalococcoidia bacterium]